MSEQFWKEKYYKSLENKKGAQLGLSLNIATEISKKMLGTNYTNTDFINMIMENGEKIYYEIDRLKERIKNG